MKTGIKEFKINLFGTLYELTFQIRITKKVPRYAIVKKDTNWIYAGHRLKVDSVYIEHNKWSPERGRKLRLSLLGTEWGKSGNNPKGYSSTVIDEIDLILEY
jgi:hypothetical protein